MHPKIPQGLRHLIAPENCKVLDLERVWCGLAKRSLAAELAPFPCWVLQPLLSSEHIAFAAEHTGAPSELAEHVAQH